MDDMPVADYLAQGGKLTSPANVPPRYRPELLKLMASFVDSEMAGSAGFADVINTAPVCANASPPRASSSKRCSMRKRCWS